MRTHGSGVQRTAWRLYNKGLYRICLDALNSWLNKRTADDYVRLSRKWKAERVEVKGQA